MKPRGKTFARCGLIATNVGGEGGGGGLEQPLNVKNAGSAGKRTRSGVQCPNGPQFKFQYGCLNYIGAYIGIKCTRQNLSRSHNMAVVYKGCLTHKPITAPYLVLLMRLHRDCVGIGYM